MAKLPVDWFNLTEEQRQELEEKLKKMSPEELKELQKQQCIFCQILSGKIPSKKIYEDEFCSAVLDINPAAKGHLLLLPKKHYAILPQIPEKEIKHLFRVAKALSQMLLKALKVDGTNVHAANGLAAGQRAQHFMLHLIPRKSGDGILEFTEKLISEEIMEKVKGAVEDRLNEVLGLKKEIFLASPDEKKPILMKEEAASKEPGTGAAAKKLPLRKRNKEKKEELKKMAEQKKPKEKKEEKKEEASLDDIANLFK